MPVLWLVASLNWDFSGRAVDHHKFNIIVHILGFPAGSDVKKSACNAGDPGSILGWEDPLKKDGSPLQYACLEKSMDRGAWKATVHGVISPINWDIWFSLINNNLLMFRLPALCCKTSI